MSRTVFLVLHLSHTDVRWDGRIGKEFDAISRVAGVRQVAVGPDRFASESRKATGLIPHGSTVAFPMWWRRLRRPRFCPGAVWGVIDFTELWLRMLMIGIRQRPDCIHCHDVWVLPVGVVIKWVFGSILIYDAHELESEANGLSRRMSRVVRWCERGSWRYISHFISVSPRIIAWYEQEFGFKPSTLVLNAPPLNVEQVAIVQQGYFQSKFGLSPKAIVFVYSGLICRGRGIETMAKVIGTKFPDIHFILLGPSNPRDSACIASNMLTSTYRNVHVHPPVAPEAVVGYLRQGDFGVCLIEDVSLSDRLCLPNKLFEYAFAGLPVLASRLPEIERVVREYGLGVCCDNDVESIRQALEAIERDGISPSTADLTELSWERQAERLREAYRQLLDRQNGTTRNQPKAGER